MTTYAFVDLGYFLREVESFARFVFPNSKDERPDMLRLKTVLGDASRMFIYYAAEQEGSGTGDTKQAERLAKQQAVIDWLGTVQRQSGVHVRWGDVKHKPRKKERIQKRVDVMLAVDMMKHAFRRTMDHAVLLTGDLDFQPLVEELVETGCHVTVAACRWSSAGHLLDAADAVIELDAVEIVHLLRSTQGAYSLSRKTDHHEMMFTQNAVGRRGVAEFGRGTMTYTGIHYARLGNPPDRIWSSRNEELLRKIVLYEIGADS